MDNNVFVNRSFNPRPNSAIRLNEEKTRFANVDKKTFGDLLEVFSLLHERLKTFSDKLDFERTIGNVFDIIRERKAELIRVKRLEDMKNNAGYALTSIIFVFGVISFVFATYIIIKNMLY